MNGDGTKTIGPDERAVSTTRIALILERRFHLRAASRLHARVNELRAVSFDIRQKRIGRFKIDGRGIVLRGMSKTSYKPGHQPGNNY